MLSQLVQRIRREHAFPLAHATALSLLEIEGPQTTSALAAAQGIRPQSMAQTLGDLEDQKLISRRPDRNDRRRVLFDLTGKGRRLLGEERRRREGWLVQAIESELTPDERELLMLAVPLLRRLVQS